MTFDHLFRARKADVRVRGNIGEVFETELRCVRRRTEKPFLALNFAVLVFGADIAILPVIGR